MIRIIIAGAAGRMGRRLVANIAESEDLALAGATERAGSEFLGLDAGSVASVRPLGVRITENFEELLDGADAVVSCTSSPHVVFEADKVAAAIRTARARLFVDLAVPPDVDPAVGAIAGCTVKNIDGFLAEARENNAKRRAAAEKGVFSPR